MTFYVSSLYVLVTEMPRIENEKFIVNHPSLCNRSSRPRREIIPLDKWEILPDQIEYEEELGRGAFGVVYKAILKKRQGLEVFDSREELTSQDTQVVAVKELQGAMFLQSSLNFHREITSENQDVGMLF